MSVRATAMLLNVFLNPTINTDGIGAPDIGPMSLAQKGYPVDIGNETYDWVRQQRLSKVQLAQSCGHVTSYTNGGNDRNCDD
jgi:hypothetical protein